MSEKELKPQFTIEEMQLKDIKEATEMRLPSSLDTYPNQEHGVSREWVEGQNARQQRPEVAKARHERFEKMRTANRGAGWVAKDSMNKIIGVTTPYIDEDGVQHVGSLYVGKEWHGTGVGSVLMQEVIDRFDDSKPIELGVASYNDRAKAFYRKWEFEEVSDSETLFDGKIPEIRMIRKAKQ